MRNHRFAGVAALLLVGCWGAIGGVNLSAGQESDLSLKLQLIWGTDGDKPNDPQLRELTPKLHDKLRRVFKWKHYWEVGTPHSVAIPLRSARRVVMSPKCELEVRNLGEATLEVKLYGEGKFVKKVRQPMKLGECSILAGDDKNDNAWFVILSLKER